MPVMGIQTVCRNRLEGNDEGMAGNLIATSAIHVLEGEGYAEGVSAREQEIAGGAADVRAGSINTGDFRPTQKCLVETRKGLS